MAVKTPNETLEQRLGENFQRFSTTTIERLTVGGRRYTLREKGTDKIVYSIYVDNTKDLSSALDRIDKRILRRLYLHEDGD